MHGCRRYDIGHEGRDHTDTDAFGAGSPDRYGSRACRVGISGDDIDPGADPFRRGLRGTALDKLSYSL